MLNSKKKTPTLLILTSGHGVVAERRSNERRRAAGAGRPTMYDTIVTKNIQFRVTEEQCANLKTIAADENRKLAAIIRDAVNEYVSDYLEKKPFVNQKKTYIPE